MTFLAPFWLALLPLPLILLAIRIWWQHGRRASSLLAVSRLEEAAPDRMAAFLGWLPEILITLSFLVGLIALARPVSQSSEQEVTAEGIDIVLCLDLSGSMRAMDFRPNRFEVARNVAREFVSQREHDRIGLVVFAGEAYTQCPLSLDHQLLDQLLAGLALGKMEEGTAIGLAMATGLNRLKESQAESRILILLTDGVNNSGLDPRTAMSMAADLGVKVYTIGVGTDQGVAPMPVSTPWGEQIRQVQVEIDEKLLAEIAEATGGKAFRATDEEELKQIYAEIDKLESTEYTVTEYHLIEERFHFWLYLALTLFGLERLFRLAIRRAGA
jgi:Ca-activated chloride channel family protein